MDYRDDKPKRQLNINRRPILFLLAGLTIFSLILLVTMVEVSKGAAPAVSKPKGASGSTASSGKTAPTPAAYDGECVAIVKAVDTQGRLITLFNVDSSSTLELSYTGGTNITDKYGQVISMSQVPIGSMADAGYIKQDGRLISLNISNKAWEYDGVMNLNINKADKIMQIAQTKYKYTDDLAVLDGDKFVSVDDLAEQDELTVRGYDQTIWSITITKGHGTVMLTDVGDFLGGSVTVGYEAMQQINEDTVIVSREGNYNLTAENGEYSGTKNVTVYRNKETVVSLKDLGPGAVKHGLVTFEINPFGADLKIDGKTAAYANPVELAYGEHDITVALGGYTTYTGKLNVDAAGKTIMIDLPEAESKTPVNVQETKDSNTESEASQDTSDTSEQDSSDSTAAQHYSDWGNPADKVDKGSETSGGTTDVGTAEKYTVDDNHTVYIQNPVGASVYLNGDFLGISPGHFKKVTGSQVLTFIKDGYATKSYTVNILDDGKDTYISFPELVPEKK